jgi:hypothetical protein
MDDDEVRIAPKVSGHLRLFVQAVRADDDAVVQERILQLSQSRRLFAPLAYAVGGIAMVFDGLKLLFSNWRLMLVQILPAMWVWAAMADLRLHVLKGESFHVLRGPILIPIVLVIAVITAWSFFLNAVFAFAIVQEGVPQVRPAFAEARRHSRVILGSGPSSASRWALRQRLSPGGDPRGSRWCWASS